MRLRWSAALVVAVAMITSGCGDNTPDAAEETQTPTIAPGTQIPGTSYLAYGDWRYSADIGETTSLAVQILIGEQQGDTRTLSVRCRPASSQLDVFAVFGNQQIATPALGAPATVAYSIHPAGIRDPGSNWTVSFGGEGAFSPQPVALARLLADNGGESATITITTDDVSGIAISGTFSLNGAESAVRRVLEACGH